MHIKTACSSRVVIQYFNRKICSLIKDILLTLPDEGIENYVILQF